MDDLAKLFENCAFKVKYEQIGDSVNYAFVGKGKRLEIYFQGSNSITDWVRNFMFGKRPYKDMSVPYKAHRGFLAAWKEAEDIVIAEIERKNKDGSFRWNEIVIVGYSHGGALSGLCHECCWFHRPDLRIGKIRGYGFESPRFYAGFKVKAELKPRWENYTVIRTGNDVVTHCPPVLFGYRHVGKMIRLPANVAVCPNKKAPHCVKCHYPEVVLDALSSLDQNKSE